MNENNARYNQFIRYSKIDKRTMNIDKLNFLP